MSHLLSLIQHEETTNKFSELKKRVYGIETDTPFHFRKILRESKLGTYIRYKCAYA
jgi:hypothetical protein